MIMKFALGNSNLILAAATSLCLISQPSLAAPATSSETRTYAMIGAMNICVLDTLNVDFDKALLSSSVAITRIIEDKHNSQFEGFQGSGDLWSSEEDIRQAVAVQLSILVDYLCKEKLSPSNSKKLGRVLDSSRSLKNALPSLEKSSTPND